MDNRKIAIALHQLPGVGSGTLHKIHQLVEGDWNSLLEDFPSFYFYQLGLAENVITQIQEHLTVEKIEEIDQLYKNRGIHICMYGESSYPPLLAEIANPPFLLYGIGSMTLLAHNNIGIVGTRTPSTYGQMVAHKLAGELAESSWTIVSGLANGIDSYAHRGALAVQGKTIAVLGCGIDIVYPKVNQKLYEEIKESGGLIVSEYPIGLQPNRGLFPQRNRIISGLSQGVIIVECHQKSGSLITANWAIEQNREVFAVPGSILSAKSSGPHNLIKEGAKIVTSTRDILEELAYPTEIKISKKDKTKAIPPQLSKAEQELMDIISFNQIHIDEIILSTNLSRGEIHQNLLSLELKNLITKLPGLFYTRI